MCLYLLALKMGSLRGTITKPEYQSLLAELETVPEKVQCVLDSQTSIQKFAANNFNKSKVFFIGRLYDSATSLECALKLKEVSYMHSEAFAAGELKHGPIALVDSDTLVVAVASMPELYDKIGSNIVEVKTRGAANMVITQDNGDNFKASADEVISIPVTDDAFAAMLSI